MTDPLQHELRARFRSTTEVRLLDVARLLDALEEDATNGDALQRLARHFHALAGLGGTYGYPRVSEFGDELEASIPKNAAPARPVIARWRALIAEVERELEATHDVPLPVVERVRARRVLVVDDDPAQLAIMRHVLGDAGYDVETCRDPREFDECIAAFAPDLVLMDEQVGGTSGAQLAQRIAGTPVIFVTGDRGANADDLVPKPVPREALLARIASRLR
jgi:CheY-like chemotaxis protein